uniref:Protein kinase domain-containing protein n=2 Tax=Kalanchoe fedtschenkoi TaxID=63787 RepID=A0A7N0TYY8_KALFE
MERKENAKFPIGPGHYTLYEEVGQGVSASVHRALCTPLNEIVAIKILDFERENCDLNNISREAQTMLLVDHPNVLKAHCSFVTGHNLWVVMPYMAGGSCLHILKAAYPDGFEEVVIATILREVLKGLEYLHHHGHIHRDVKAGNILISSRGATKLGDFGVSACLFDSGDRQRMRNTFVGTPCWMAPEVMEQLHGYDFKADIWSFGITALELAHGHAPFSKYPPMKVLLMTLQNAPPSLDYERDRKFSRSFKQMTASCLVKDPSKRPTAKKLLKHSFFKQARSNDYISRTLLEGLPALGDRLKELKKKEEDMLAQKKMPDGQKEELSQNEYKRGISGWNFNIEDVKAQASLIQDIDDCVSDDVSLDSSNHGHLPQVDEADDNDLMRDCPSPLPARNTTPNGQKAKTDKSDEEPSVSSSIGEVRHESNGFILDFKRDFDKAGSPVDKATVYARRGGSTELNALSDIIVPPSPADSGKLAQIVADNIPISNGGITPQGDGPAREAIGQPARSANDEPDEKARRPVVQQKGRFKVTSENLDMEKVAPTPMLQKSHSMQVITQHQGVSLPPQSMEIALPATQHGNSTFPMLLSILHTNMIQRDAILNLMKQFSGGDTTGNHDSGNVSLSTNLTEKSLLEAAHDREKELVREVTELQWRLICAQEELNKYKTEHAQVNN